MKENNYGLWKGNGREPIAIPESTCGEKCMTLSIFFYIPSRAEKLNRIPEVQLSKCLRGCRCGQYMVEYSIHGFVLPNTFGGE